MNLKWRYGLLLFAPSLLLIGVAWLLGAWSLEETVSNPQTHDEDTELEISTHRSESQHGAATQEGDAPMENVEAENTREAKEYGPELTSRITGFLEELHSRDPHEPSEARELRIREYATDQFWHDISPFLSNEAEDRVMIEDEISVEATASVLRIEQLSSYRAFVVAEIDVTVYEGGVIHSSYQPRHMTIWIKRDGEWYVNEARYG